MINTLPHWLAGEILPQPQDDSQVTYCHLIAKSDGQLEWRHPAEDLERQVRAYTPWPTAFTYWQGKHLKVLRAAPVPEQHSNGQTGLVVALEGGAGVVTGEGILRLLEMQLAGKRAMTIKEFLRGQRGFVGSLLGASTDQSAGRKP